MELIKTSMHTIVKDDISSMSVAFDDQNPNLFALQIFMKNGKSIMPLFANSIEYIFIMKELIEDNWFVEKVFDLEKHVDEVNAKINELIPNKAHFYNFMSAGNLLTELSEYKERVRNQPNAIRA